MFQVHNGVMGTQLEAGPQTGLTVDGHSGDVTIRATSEAVIRVRAHGYDPDEFNGQEPLIVTRDGDQVRLEYNREAGSYELDLEILVPHGCALKVTTVSGDVTIAGARAPVEVETIDGNISVHEAHGECTLKTVGGDIELGATEADCTISTIDGDIHIHRARGRMRVDATNGDVRIEESTLSRMTIDSINGEVTVHTPLLSEGQYRVTSTNGDVTLFVPHDTRASAHMKTQEGDIRTNLPAEVTATDKRNWQGNINGGGADVYLESINGSLAILVGSSDRHGEGEFFTNFAGIAAIPPVPPVPPIPPIPTATTHIPPVPPVPPIPAIPPIPSTSHLRGSTVLHKMQSEPHSGGVGKNDDTIEILAMLERGEITVEEAMSSLEELG